MQAYQQRHSLNKSKKKQLVVSAKKEIMYLEKIQDSITYLVEWHTDTINKYRFPAERILEIVAPKALQKAIFGESAPSTVSP